MDTDDPGAAEPQPHSNNQNGKKIDGKKNGTGGIAQKLDGKMKIRKPGKQE
jgi:hypothetical protein